MFGPQQAFGGMNKSPMSKVDLRIVALVIGLALSLFLAFWGDQAVFVKKPDSHIQAILSYTTIIGFEFTESRFLAFAFTLIIYFTILAIGGFFLFWYLEIYVIEPIVIKRKMMYVKREKKLMNKYDDGTL